MVSVARILEGAFGLVREQIAAVAIWAGIYLAANVALLLTMQPLMAQALAGSPGIPVGPDSTVADRMSGIGLLLPLYGMNFILMLVGIVLYTAAMRAVLRPQAAGLGFLRVGMDELRMLALVLLFGVAGMILLTSFGLIFGLFTAGAAMSESIGATILIGVLGGFAVFALFLYILVRFSLAFPLTLHRRQIVIGEAWRLSKGRSWALFGAALVVTLIGFALTMVIGVFAAGSYLPDIMAASGNSEAAALAAERQMTSAYTFGPAMIVQSIAGAAIGALWIALSGGSAATAAKLMLDAEFDDAEQVFG